jgi:hypothetical protein
VCVVVTGQTEWNQKEKGEKGSSINGNFVWPSTPSSGYRTNYFISFFLSTNLKCPVCVCLQSHFWAGKTGWPENSLQAQHTHTLSVYRRRHCPSLLVVCIFKRKVKKRGGMMVKSFSFSKEKEEGNIVECRPVPLLQQTYPQPKRFLGVLLKGRVCVCVG